MFYETFYFFIFYLAWRSFRCTSFNKKLQPLVRTNCSRCRCSPTFLFRNS